MKSMKLFLILFLGSQIHFINASSSSSASAKTSSSSHNKEKQDKENFLTQEELIKMESDTLKLPRDKWLNEISNMSSVALESLYKLAWDERSDDLFHVNSLHVKQNDLEKSYVAQYKKSMRNLEYSLADYLKYLEDRK